MISFFLRVEKNFHALVMLCSAIITEVTTADRIMVPGAVTVWFVIGV